MSLLTFTLQGNGEVKIQETASVTLFTNLLDVDATARSVISPSIRTSIDFTAVVDEVLDEPFSTDQNTMKGFLTFTPKVVISQGTY
jgi:hypothetical protein